MTIVHTFCNASQLGNRAATHRKTHGYQIVGYRIAEEIDDTKLTAGGRRLVELMEADLSGVLEDDDLTPRLVRRQTTVGITEAADLLGADRGLAGSWAAAYGAHCESGEEWYDVRFYLLGHDTIEAAINATAELPGIAVRPNLHAEPIPLNEHPLDDGPEHRLLQAGRWAHMLRRSA